MLRNYFKTAVRHLRKNRTFSFINIAGLAIGTLCCLYIVLFVDDQYSYDRQHRGVADLYRVNTLITAGGNDWSSGSSSPAIVRAMKREIPEVRDYTRIQDLAMLGAGKQLIKYNEKAFYEPDLFFVDSTFFDVFRFHFVQGSPDGVLAEPYTVVLLQSLAEKLFGGAEAVGKTIRISNSYGKHDFRVTGVVDESLGKSHLHAQLFAAMSSKGMGAYAYDYEEYAGENVVFSYVRLQPGASPGAVEKKLPALLQKYGAEQLKRRGMKKELVLQPVRTIHTTTRWGAGLDKPVSPAFLGILLSIATLIQLIACINFMNLSTARAARRAKEVGVRKVLGVGRRGLVRQFLGESFLLSLMGVLIALPLLATSLSWLNRMTNANVEWSLMADPKVWGILAGVVALTGLVAGSYPAFYLSAFNVTKVLKGNFTSQLSAAGIRRVLVVFQFTLSIGLMAAIIVIHSQLYFVAHKDLGFERDQQLVFAFNTDDARTRISAFMSDLQQVPEIKTASNSSFYLSQYVPNNWIFQVAGGAEAPKQMATFITSDEHFVSAAGIRILSGRDLQLQDSERVLINETLARGLGLDVAKAPGTRLFEVNGNPRPVEIVGVMKDFNYNSLHEDIKPFMVRYGPNGLSGWGFKLSYVTVKISAAEYGPVLAKVEKLWHKDLPGEPFVYSFLRDEVQKQYDAEATLSAIINTFTGMAIFISCLGLFGLAAFSAEQRTKEIGVRKVLGASEAAIVRLLSKDFIRLTGIAFLIAAPLAWWAMNKWLEGFALAYRIRISWWMMSSAGAIALLVTLLTVGVQALKAALANPVRSLRSE